MFNGCDFTFNLMNRGASLQGFIISLYIAYIKCIQLQLQSNGE